METKAKIMKMFYLPYTISERSPFHAKVGVNKNLPDPYNHEAIVCEVLEEPSVVVDLFTGTKLMSSPKKQKYQKQTISCWSDQKKLTMQVWRLL